MKKTFGSLLSIVCVACFATLSIPAQAAHTKSHKANPARSAKPAAAKPSGKTRKPAAKLTTKSNAKSASSGSKKNVVESNAVQTCKSVRVKTAKGHRTQRNCASSEGALQSPIGAGDINALPGSGKTELKARTIPDRAYAVDGYTFFHQGRKYRVIGINEGLVPAGSDMAKQRLQLALDSGAISVEPEAVDDNGTMRAMVRVAGKNLADVLNASR